VKWHAVVKVALIAVAVLYVNTMLVWWAATAYARGQATSRAAIIEAYPNPLYEGETALYPTQRNMVVRFMDAAGVFHERLMTPEGLRALEKWVEGR